MAFYFRAVYKMVKQEVVGSDGYFKQIKDCTGKQSANTCQKLVAALSQLIHEVLAPFL